MNIIQKDEISGILFREILFREIITGTLFKGYYSEKPET